MGDSPGLIPFFKSYETIKNNTYSGSGDDGMRSVLCALHVAGDLRVW